MTTNRHARRAAAAKEAKGDAKAIEGAPPAANDQKLPPRKRGRGRPKKQPHPHAD